MGQERQIEQIVEARVVEGSDGDGIARDGRAAFDHQQDDGHNI